MGPKSRVACFCKAALVRVRSDKSTSCVSVTSATCRKILATGRLLREVRKRLDTPGGKVSARPARRGYPSDDPFRLQTGRFLGIHPLPSRGNPEAPGGAVGA